MRHSIGIGLALGVLLLAAGPALAQMETPAACPAPVAASGVYAAWNVPRAVVAGRTVGDAAVLAPGTAYAVTLLPTPTVVYAQRPAKPGEPVSHGGLLVFDVARAGTVRIALGAAAWIDVIGAQGTATSIAHGHGPDCTGIRKMVDFALAPGHYVLQIAASAPEQVTVLPLLIP